MFTNVLINNSKLIADMLREGINAYTDLVEGRFLSALIKMGVVVMEWIGDYKNAIVL